MVDTSKDDDEEVQRKREEREAAKRKEEKVGARLPVLWEICSCCISNTEHILHTPCGYCALQQSAQATSRWDVKEHPFWSWALLAGMCHQSARVAEQHAVEAAPMKRMVTAAWHLMQSKLCGMSLLK